MNVDGRAAETFGRALARARRSQGLTQEALAHALGFSASHLSNLERGRREPPLDRITDFDGVLAPRESLAELWDRLTGNGRQAWLYEFSEMVRDAKSVNEYQVMTFPGYLQTENYAHAVMRAGAPWLPPKEVTHNASERASWGSRVVGSDTPILWTVADLSVLWRRYGGVHVMREQLAHIIDLVKQDRLILQLLPADAQRHPGTSGTFALLTGDEPDVVYAESIHFGQFVTSESDVYKYRMLFGALQGAALGPDESLARLREESTRLP